MQALRNLILGLATLVQSTLGVSAASNQPITFKALSQAAPNLIYTQSRITNNLTFLSGFDRPLPVEANQPSGQNPESAARRALVNYGYLFGIENQAEQLNLAKFKTDELGMLHLKFQQNYQGVPIWGGELLVHLDQKQETVAVNGETLTNINLDTNPQISAEQARQIAQTLWQKQFGVPAAKVSPPQLFVFNPQLITKQPDQNHLTWEIEAGGPDSDGLEQREFFYIDAHTGKLAFQLPGIFEVRNRRTYDCNQTSSCTPTYQENDNPAGTDEISNLHRFAADTYDYYFNTHQRDSYNSGGATIRSRGRYRNIRNAFWNGSSLTFGPGFGVLDVLGHEFTHGVVQYSAGLPGSGQGGALNESYADIFGTAIDKPDWELGEDIPGGAIRDMANPPRFNHPDSFYSNLYYCGSSNSRYVHINNGVNNKAAYLIAQGGNLNNCNVSGIGRDKQEAIFYRALTVYLTRSSGFNENYTALIQACGDLYGAGSSECSEVSKAVEATGMDEPSPCSSQSPQPPTCAGAPPGATPTPTPTPGPNPTPTPTPSSNFLIMRISLEGVSQDRGAQNVRLEIPAQSLNQPVGFSWNNTANVYEGQVDISGLPAGTYDIFLTGPAHLRKKFAGININPNQSQTVDWSSQPLLGGDANLDNTVDQNDVGLLSQGYQDLANTFNADFNLDSQVDAQDVTILSWNYGRSGN